MESDPLPLPVFTETSSSLLEVRVDSRLVWLVPKLYAADVLLGLSLYSDSDNVLRGRPKDPLSRQLEILSVSSATSPSSCLKISISTRSDSFSSSYMSRGVRVCTCERE